MTAVATSSDRTNLIREIRGQEVHVAREVLPRARGPGDVRLASEAPFDADFARDVRHLLREGREGVRHVVDRVGESRDFALRFDGQFLAQVAVRRQR